MLVKIIGMEPTDDGKTRMVYMIDGESNNVSSLLLEPNDLNSINTVKNAVAEQLKGKKFINESFEI